MAQMNLNCQTQSLPARLLMVPARLRYSLFGIGRELGPIPTLRQLKIQGITDQRDRARAKRTRSIADLPC